MSQAFPPGEVDQEELDEESSSSAFSVQRSKFRSSRTGKRFWWQKMLANKRRDALVTRTLRRAGWRVVRVWEHELARKNQSRLLRRLSAAIGS